MSATFGDDSILVTHFDAASESVSNPIVPTSSGDIGDRMILVPQELNPDFSDEDLKAYFKGCSQWANVVVLVPSDHRAKFWANVAVETLRSETLTDGVARLRAGHVDLVVFVNKYDGVNLPEDACRILVLDGLPDVRGRFDKVEQSILMGSDEAVRGSMQRVEQGMGRGVRSNDDHCAVFLMGRSLTGQLYARNAMAYFTPATRAQVDLSAQLAKQLQRPTILQMHDVVRRFLGREDGWVRASKAAVVLAKHRPNAVLNPVSLAQRQAFNSASRGDFRQACADIQRAIDVEKNGRVKGWLLWQLAELQYRTDPVQSQQILKSAAWLISQVVHPLEGIEYVRLPTQLAEQASLCSDYLRATYTNPNNFVVEMNAYLDALVFLPETADRFERTLAEVARLIGFASQEPERDFGHGPDVLWSVGHQRFFVIECKNGATVETICKDYCNQLTGSMVWFQNKYGDAALRAVMRYIHPANSARRL
ncbi:helicase C-terminal domain-containing protein [Sorangium sp. So ce341]|uniref:helicase C-terminal domain-containing protein n=1 Tax=Sorangium sp. So ce341 TaxID=3133302 RepID=UPI003F6046DE